MERNMDGIRSNNMPTGPENGGGCQDVEPLDKPVDHEALAEANVAYLMVGGMGCPRCATRVRNGLMSLSGVVLADVFLEQGQAAVAFDPKKVEPDDLVRAVFEAGNDGRHNYQAGIAAVRPINETLVLEYGRRVWR